MSSSSFLTYIGHRYPGATARTVEIEGRNGAILDRFQRITLGKRCDKKFFSEPSAVGIGLADFADDDDRFLRFVRRSGAPVITNGITETRAWRNLIRIMVNFDELWLPPDEIGTRYVNSDRAHRAGEFYLQSGIEAGRDYRVLHPFQPEIEALSFTAFLVLSVVALITSKTPIAVCRYCRDVFASRPGRLFCSSTCRSNAGHKRKGGFFDDGQPKLTNVVTYDVAGPIGVVLFDEAGEVVDARFKVRAKPSASAEGPKPWQVFTKSRDALSTGLPGTCAGAAWREEGSTASAS